MTNEKLEGQEEVENNIFVMFINVYLSQSLINACYIVTAYFVLWAKIKRGRGTDIKQE